MLGRLFNNNRSNEHINKGVPSNPLLPLHHHHHHQHQSMSGSSSNVHTPPTQVSLNTSNTECFNYSNEDSYSRTILYGTPNHLQSFNLEAQSFRLVIIQDKGELLMKNNYKTHYDSALDPHFNRPIHNKLSNKHESSELVEIMFGNPIHHDLNRSDNFKIHVMSSLPDLKNSILVSMHFYFDKKHKFAIGIVIPIGLNDISSVVLSNWVAVSNHLNLLKAIFIENHLNIKKCTNTSTQMASSNYLDISIFFKTFIKSIKYLSTVPRLLLGLIKFDSILQNWCFEVNNWIEVKDGAKLGFSGTKFLTTLLSIVYGLKNQLVSKKNDESVRVVIMASNPMVAQKLIFIISGLLPFNLNFKVTDYEDDDKSLEDTVVESTDDLNDLKIEIPQEKTPPTPSVIKQGWEIPTTPSRSVATPSIMTPCRSSIIQPATSMSTSNSMAYLSSSLSSSSTFSTSLSRGFQLLQNWKNTGTSDDGNNQNNTPSSSSSSVSYKTPSPNNEPDDYPWYSNLNQISHPNYTLSSSSSTGHHLSRTSSSYDLSCCLSNIPKSIKRLSIPKLPHVERSTTTLFKIGESQKTKSQLFNNTRKSCFSLLSSKSLNTRIERDNVKGVSILDVPFDDDEEGEDEEFDNDFRKGETYNDYKRYPLPQLCGYVNEFIPDFKLQACPISQDLDSKLASAMKNDLDNFKSSKTILVSLRAREIKEMTLVKKSYEYKSTMKKLYHNPRPSSSIDKESWTKIDTLLNSIVSIFRDHDQQTDDRDFAEVERLLERL